MLKVRTEIFSQAKYDALQKLEKEDLTKMLLISLTFLSVPVLFGRNKKKKVSGLSKPTLSPVHPLTIRGSQKRGSGTLNFHLIAKEITLPSYSVISIIFTWF